MALNVGVDTIEARHPARMQQSSIAQLAGSWFERAEWHLAQILKTESGDAH